ncbi:hypothetical protein DFJ58DRAFT_733251 [Suillus subalutaceus]|uniref:uncharacterized protein n=1 Tax=Suillus subalutaceus TaxID=48586 RepID=UPI001B87E3F7|nr:uncharacterized protein DFJ58DRAFT_733251 [Suillus subalutaceus]KAG1839661.1 hypothetical protein DFJ58DRAFT_733251 [Suillus subalutaceus]
MSSSQHANNALNLVAEKIDRLVKRSEKLKASTPAAKTLAHEIAATAFAQHGNAATSLAPLLLSCAAEIRDKNGINGKLKALPDWGTISDEDPQILTHPLFPKSVGYRHPQPLAPPAILAELPAPLPPAPSTPTPVQPALAPSPVPPVTIVPKAKLFVPGNSNNGNIKGNRKHRASTPEANVDASKAVEPAAKKARTHSKKHKVSKAPRANSRARSTKVKSKEFITDDEHDEVLADKVIFVKSKTTAVPSTQPAIPVAKSKDTQPADSASEDDALAEDDPSVHLFSVQCERCIKDNPPCAVILSKKNGEIRKCCRCCDEKKTKCIRPTTEEATILRAVAAKKKAKAANKKAPVNTRAASRVHVPSVGRTLSPLVDKSTNEDAEGEDVVEPGTPAPNVDNNVNMDFDTQTAAPDLPVSDVPVDAPPNQAVQQPSNLDIIQMIQAMHQEFAGMLQNSGDRAEAVNRAINTRVNDLAHNWEERFAAMEKKMWEVELHTAGNMVSIGHMANAMKAFTASGDVSAFQPPPGPSTQRHPFGQIPPSWITQLPPLADDGHLQDPSASEVGKLFTTAWDESRGPGAGVAGESSASCS